MQGLNGSFERLRVPPHCGCPVKTVTPTPMHFQTLPVLGEKGVSMARLPETEARAHKRVLCKASAGSGLQPTCAGHGVGLIVSSTGQVFRIAIPAFLFHMVVVERRLGRTAGLMFHKIILEQEIFKVFPNVGNSLQKQRPDKASRIYTA